MLEVSLPEQLDVLVVLGSVSDQAIAEQIAPVFAEFGVSAHFEVCSAHRDHERLELLVAAAEEAGCRVYIGVAGMAAHLPGVIAALTPRPVIGVPCAGSLDGLDALLAVVQMPPGVPVACVAVGGGRNAAVLAVEMLALDNDRLTAQLDAYRDEMRERNRQASEQLKRALASK
jgi:5-(carboxyamino)imidazole ribonucleotide mutase